MRQHRTRNNPHTSPMPPDSNSDPGASSADLPPAASALETCPTCIHASPAVLARVANSAWVACDVCKQWYHLYCLPLDQTTVDEITEYHCPQCERDGKGPSVKKRVSKRKRTKVDYKAFDRGEVNVTRDRHPYASRFDGIFVDDNESESLTAKAVKTEQPAAAAASDWYDVHHQVPELDGDRLTKQWAESTGIVEPLKIPAHKYSSLDMQVPADLTVDKVADLLGADSPVQVVDVLTQNLATPAWDMGLWAAYFRTPQHDRDRILNVISLEVSGTPLGDLVERPRFVRDMDWVDMVWPADRLARNDYPKARLYCLMSVRDAYTDFHIDFGGTSVFYHLIHGSKLFIFVKPTPANLRKYEAWCNSATQNSVFFADLVNRRDHVHVVHVRAGDSLIIPSGWIHAVYTPTDSLVIGGNFLTPINIGTQIELARLEARTRVPQKFRYPFFDRVVWYAAVHYQTVLQNKPGETTEKVLPKLELQGLASLRDYLYDHVAALESADKQTAGYVKHLQAALPKSVKKQGPRQFVDEFARLIANLDVATIKPE